MQITVIIGYIAPNPFLRCTNYIDPFHVATVIIQTGIITLYFFICSDQIYLLKIIIAIIDHNHHIVRDYRKSQSGEIQQHRVWRRRSKRWDAIPKKVKKNYSYVPEVLLLIFKYREKMDQPLRSIMGKKRIGSTITPDPPPSTTDIVKRKKSRFYAEV